MKESKMAAEPKSCPVGKKLKTIKRKDGRKVVSFCASPSKRKGKKARK